MEEIVRAMNYVIEQGWAFYWGTSEWKAAEVLEACEVADRLGLIRPVCDQTRYNILDRSRVDYDFVNLYKKYKYGVTAFSALSAGVLTGKYSDGIPEGSRMSIPFFKQLLSNGLEEKTAKALQLAELDENLKALAFEEKITPEIRAKIDAIADFKPELTKVQDNVHQIRGKWA
ncbi:putative voltage-gated potassium channel subunit beta [Phytophthora ramorum]|uniref:putative voltage-gated potassium channel subunit beta n=1 Tax=Phytophthora ramorum TaxID=164328 RepID=UPI00309BB6AC|nr:putative voltage-gated potassium channel subunit beta [Phytophthora ramorum]